MKLLRHKLVALLLLCWSAIAHGQTDSLLGSALELGPIVIMEVMPIHVAYGGKVWDSDSVDLAAGKMGNVADILRGVPSLSMKRYAPGGLASPTLRGTGAGHTQVYWEGLPLNSPMLGQQDFALGAGSLFNAVSARYGGNSLFFGSGGLGGAILLRSGEVANYVKPVVLQLHQQVGSFGTVASNAKLSFWSQQFRSTTSLYFNSAKNNFPFYNSGKAGAPLERLPNAAVTQWGGLHDVQYFYRKGLVFLKLWALQSERNLPPTMLAQDARESQTDDAMRALGGWRTNVFKGSFYTDVAYFRERLTYRNPLAGIVAPSSFERGIAQMEYRPFYPGSPRIKLVETGLRYTHDRARSDGYAGHLRQDLGSMYAHGVAALGGNRSSRMSLVLREEYSAGRFSPLLSYLGGAFGKRTQLAISATHNYRYPTLNDRYWVPGGNPNLRPERSYSFEAGLQNNPYRQKQWRADFYIGGYWNVVNDWILWLPLTGNIWQPENVLRVNARGIEAHYGRRGRWHNFRYDISLQYNFNDSRDQAGYQLIYTPRHNTTFRLHMDRGRWNLYYFQDWNSRRYTVADNSAFIAGFSTADVSVGCALGKGNAASVKGEAHSWRDSYHLQAGVRNIWNAAYQTVAWRPMPGRSWFFRVDIELGKLRNEK